MSKSTMSKTPLNADDELQATCLEIQKLTGLMDDAWQREFGNKKGLYGFILADRKKHELEARIAEDKFVLKQLKDIWRLTNYAKIKVFIENRIAQLKAQQEENGKS